MPRHVMDPIVHELTSDTLQFAKFNGTNYHVWSDNMKAALQEKSLWGVVSGRDKCPPELPSEYPGLLTTICPTPGIPPVTVRKDGQELLDVLQSRGYQAWERANDRFDRWLSKDHDARVLIRNAIEYTQRKSILNLKNSKAIWDHLHKCYVDQQRGVIVHCCYQQLYAKKWDGHTSMCDHICFYLNVRRRFIEADHKVDDYVIINAILLSLPISPTWEVIKQNLLYRGNALTLDNVSAELMSAFERITLEDNLTTESLAFPSEGDQFSSGSKPDTKSTKTKIKSKSNRESNPDGVCHNCGEKGHWSPKCPKPRKSRGVGNANIPINEVQNQRREIGQVPVVPSDENSTGLLLASAASCHMIADQSFFTEYRETDNQHILVGGLHKEPVSGMGSIVFRTYSPTGANEIQLRDVLHIPNLGANLISLGLLQRAGATIEGLQFGLRLSRNDKEFLRANLVGTHGTLYRIECTKVGHYDNQVAFIASESTMRL